MRPFSSRVPWGVVAFLVAGGGCATRGEPPPAAAAPFPEVKSAALLRWVERGPERPKDALDALAASLAERGITTHVRDLGPGRSKALADVERLYGDVESRVWSGSGLSGRSRDGQPLGADAARTVRALGADAVALYLRFDARLPGRGAAGPMPPFGFPPSGPVDRPSSGAYRPVAAIALVSRDGTLVWFDWGPRDETRDPEGPVNAAEAVDAAARLLAGEREDA